MRQRAARSTHRFSVVSVAVVLIAAVTLSGTGASAQNIESLRVRAERISNELDALEQRASELDEQYLALGEELAELEQERTEQQAAVAQARTAVESARTQATGYLVEAYIGAGSHDRLSLGSTDVNAAVSQRALLEIVRGDRELLADDMDVTRQDLDDRVAALARSERELDERRAEQQGVADEIESAVDEHRTLLEGANGELRAAIQAEQERREAEAAKAAERERAAAAAREARQQTAAAAAAATTTADGPRSESSGSSRRRSSGGAPAPTPAAPTPAAPIPVSAPNGRAAGAIAAARSVLGTPYRWAGSSPGGFDCSGLLVWSWAKVGVSLPRTSRGMYSGTQRIAASQLQPGDLVFYGSPVHHVGMYVGGGQMIHSPRTGDVVKIAPIQRGFGNPSGYGRIR